MNGLFKALLLALPLASLPATAQDAEEPDSTQVEASEAKPADEQATEREALEPGVPSTVLAQDVRRRTTGGGAVMDEMDLGRTEITGNQELPKVLYIVPWKKADPGELMGKPVNTLLDEVLAPLDREEFIRRVDYYDDLYREDNE